MKRVVITAVLILGGAVLAQVSTGIPGTAPASQAAAPATSPATMPVVVGPVTLPSTLPVAETQPATSPSTQLSGFASTAPTTAFATSGPSSNRSYSSSSSSFERFPSRDYRDRSFSTPADQKITFIAKPILREYQPVLTRSIFKKGSQIVRDTGDLSNPPPAVASFSGNPVPPTTSWSPESMLVFNGAAREESGRMVAFIENTGLNQITRYQLGEAVAQGKVAGINLDSLDYQVGSRTTHVMLGQNLLGVDTQVLTTQPVVASGATPSSPTTSGSATTSGAGGDSVLERLRQRRLKELSGK